MTPAHRKSETMFDRIASFSALRQAALNAAKGKRRKPGAAAFLARLEPEILTLERALRDDIGTRVAR